MRIDRERWREIQAEFGQDEEPLGHPRVSLAEGAVSVEFGNGEGEVSIWVTQKSARVDLGGLSLYADRERKLLLRTVGPYPIQQWDVLYDSNNKPDISDWYAGQSLQDAMSATSTAETAATSTTEIGPSLELVQQLLVALRAGLGLYYRGTVTETDPAVPLVVDILKAVIADWSADLTERAVQIVRAVRSMVPMR